MTEKPIENDETEARYLDFVEMALLFAVPVLIGFAVVLSDPNFGLTDGIGTTGGIGWILVRIRSRFYAVRTPDGISRRRRPAEQNWMVHVAEVEYDPKYDKVLAVVLAVIGIASFAALVFVDMSGRDSISFVIVGHLCLVGALMVYGVSNR
ncbi:hypothetical protein E6P09_17660 (plasmid) [Haloferax mediterranei ATCC 33500]|uniref:Uncharacterized protein n=1 Tax=Haloferax mediterranei (strain ATCC 33500 / DSM 1411 / JCM 8866 / NBRC 14739 / NCIMB 2177 / R-4) TaxID=523841 RepID=I3R9S6_HALMT|nr:hypothetical protein [Haloferax mediterranei]AFK20986.1 hypothetical protein HFX_5152 [Haloferax mediterranei ATCC 33500]AHZ24150.1 hypothetical protein BM92_18270 [Haloferax mediterranei ATCC 33500]EMA05227.1 hypothetical protein C439_00470 [Haloferax mediterranei ATCC 33500]MDX5989969.1 hypothetical protein [Haloferax mediterranei ATCC 33500]QCQ77155.1 hypothetical protein E6P09_17660 [Haloferax mediterranei ATCC 33500]